MSVATMGDFVRHRWPRDQGSALAGNNVPLEMPNGPDAAWRRTAEMVDTAHGPGAFCRYALRANRPRAHYMDSFNIHRLMHCRDGDPCMSPLCARCGGHDGLAHASAHGWAMRQRCEDGIPAGAEMIELSVQLPERYELITTIRGGPHKIHKAARWASYSALAWCMYSLLVTVVQPVVTEDGMEHRVRAFTVLPLGLARDRVQAAARGFASEMGSYLRKIIVFAMPLPKEEWHPAEARLVRGRDNIVTALYNGMAPPDRSALWGHLIRSKETILSSYSAFDYRAMVELYSVALEMEEIDPMRKVMPDKYEVLQVSLRNSPRV